VQEGFDVLKAYVVCFVLVCDPLKKTDSRSGMMYFFLCYHIYGVSEELKLNNLTEVVRFLIWLLEVLDRNLGQALATLTVVFVVFDGLK
jgi:hypothetical protein